METHPRPFHLFSVDNPARERPVLWVSVIKVWICFNYFRSMLAVASVESRGQR